MNTTSIPSTSWQQYGLKNIAFTVLAASDNPFTKGIVCVSNPKQCAIDIAKSYARYIAYEGPKFAAESAGTAVRWSAKNLLIISDKLVKDVCHFVGSQGPDLHAYVATRYHITARIADALAQKGTLWAAPKALEIAEENLLNAKITNTLPPEPFSIVDLIGPSLFMGLCANKAMENAKSTAFSAYLLLSGTRLVTTTYQATPTNWNMSADGKVNFIMTKQYTTRQLLRDILVEGLFTALWAGSGYFTYGGIQEALVNGGSDEARAEMITNALLTTATVAPTLIAAVRASLNSTPTPEGPKSASHLVYSDGKKSTTSIEERRGTESSLQDLLKSLNITPEDDGLEVSLAPQPQPSAKVKPNAIGLVSNSQTGRLFGG